MLSNHHARISGSYNLELDFEVIDIRDNQATIEIGGKIIHLVRHDQGTVNIPINVKPGNNNDRN